MSSQENEVTMAEETPKTGAEETATPAAAANKVDEDDRKLFVGGLAQDCTEAEIRAYFADFGEVQGVNLKTDQTTGRSRGFAFVLFAAVEPVEKVTSHSEPHIIKCKKVAIKKAQSKQGKVYVGKLKPEITEDDLKTFFGGYGAVAAVEQPFDKQKGEKKNFCFVTFEKEGPAKQLLKEGTVTVGGHELEVKKVTPKPDMMGGGRGGFGGGRGGGQQWGAYGGWGGGGMAAQYGDYYGYGSGGYDAYGYGGWGGAPGAAYGGYGGNGGYGGGKAPRGGAPRGRGGRGVGRGRAAPY